MIAETQDTREGSQQVQEDTSGVANGRGEGQRAGKRRETPNAHAQGAADHWMVTYLEELASTGKQLDSAKKAGVGFTTVWRRRQSDPDFVSAEAAAMQTAKALFEDELRRRALEGVERVRFGRDGSVLSTEREYSDTLLLRWLERHDPAWRSKQQVELSQGQSFDTAADRKAALEAARKAAIEGGVSPLQLADVAVAQSTGGQ